MGGCLVSRWMEQAEHSGDNMAACIGRYLHCNLDDETQDAPPADSQKILT